VPLGELSFSISGRKLSPFLHLRSPRAGSITVQGDPKMKKVLVLRGSAAAVKTKERRWQVIAKLMNLLFGCSHRNYSFPITMKSGTSQGGTCVKVTYVVCLDCARALPYDWQEMRVVNGQRSHSFGTAEEDSEEHVLSWV
jgi:hypothetical protein